MKYIIDHDFHIHTHLSICSDDEGQTPLNILNIAKKRGLKRISLADHFWDERVKLNTKYNWWYEKQNLAHIKNSLPIPKDDEVEFLFGCEADMDSDGRIGVSREIYDEFGFIIVSTTHFHHMEGPGWEDDSCEAVAKRWIERFDRVLSSDLPFHKTGFAHPVCSLINMESREAYLKTLELIPDSELKRLFKKAAEVGIGIEINSADFNYEESEEDIILRFFKIAKECGCKFYLGSDAHTREQFEGVEKIFKKAIDKLGLTEDDKFLIK